MFSRATILTAAALCLAAAASAQPQPAEPSAVTLFENVRIFDGKSDTLSASMNVLVRGNTIEKISKDPIPTDRRADTRIIARRRAHVDARADRHALAHDARAAYARDTAYG